MGDGIINMANLGWLGVLGGAYYIATNFDKVPDKYRHIALTIYESVQDYPLAFFAVIGWLVLRVLFVLGWQLQLELLMVMSVCNYGVRQIARAKVGAVQALRKELTASSNPTQVLGSRLPEWVLYPSVNRVQWLNSVLVGMWPSIVAATDNSIRSVIEPLLESHRPSFVKGFRVHSASIGPHPMAINGIQHQAYGSTETTLDISVTWSADMDIRLLIRVPGPDMEVSISDFDMKLTLRVVLGPHIPTWPCFANIAVSIVNTPEIDFDVTAGKIPLDTVPGLGNFLDHFIRRVVVGQLSYPKSVVIPIVKGYELKKGLGTGALGTLKVHFSRIDNLAKKYGKYKKTPFYCKYQLEGQAKPMRTKSYVGFSTPMEDVHSFTVYDDTGILHVWFAIDVTGNDLHVGDCTITTKQLMETDLDEVELIITKDSDASHTRRASVYIKPEFLAFTTREQQEAAITPPETVPPRKSTDSFLHEVAQQQRELIVPHSRAGSPRASLSMSTCTSGTLFIHVDRATGLANVESKGVSDPYVFLRVNASVAKSDEVRNNLNPVFGFDAEIEVADGEKDILSVRLIDKNKHGDDELMGELQMPLTRIMAAPGERVSGTFELRPRGTVTLSAQFMRHL